MRILFIGDIVGEPGRRAIKELLPKIVKMEKVDFVIANGENAAGGSGITPMLADELLGYGVDVITSGDHIWKRKEIVERLNEDSRVLRPANYPRESPGFGSTVIASKSGIEVGVINLQGRVFMQAIECPFRTAKAEVDKLKNKTRIIIVDIHAEATSEKAALAYFLDGEVSLVAGTHTHVQTSDERILSNGTAFITDVGMTGPTDSVIGRRKEQVIERFLTGMPTRFEVALEAVELQGVFCEIDRDSGRARAIKRIKECL